MHITGNYGTVKLRHWDHLRKNGLYSVVVLLLSWDKEDINEMGL